MNFIKRERRAGYMFLEIFSRATDRIISLEEHSVALSFLNTAIYPDGWGCRDHMVYEFKVQCEIVLHKAIRFYTNVV